MRNKILILTFILTLSGCNNIPVSNLTSTTTTVLQDGYGNYYLYGPEYVATSDNHYINPFDTIITATIFNMKQADRDSMESVFRKDIIKYHKLFDRHYYYEDDADQTINNLKKVNDIYATGETIEIDYHLYNILKESLNIMEQTDSKFNIAIGMLTDLWFEYRVKHQFDALLTPFNQTQLDGEDIVPNNLKLEAAKNCTPNAVELKELLILNEVVSGDTTSYTVRFDEFNKCSANTETYQYMSNYGDYMDFAVNDPAEFVTAPINKVSLSLSAVGKGYMVNEVSRYLETTDNSYGWIDGGMSSYSFFGDIDHEIPISVANPGRADIFSSTPYLEFKYGNKPFAISTSADNRNEYFQAKCDDSGEMVCYEIVGGGYPDVIDGVKINDYKQYHHIIDPSTGMPLNNNRSITLIADSAFYLDALSTALFNLERNEMFKKISELRSTYSGLEAISMSDYNFVDFSYNINITEGLKEQVIIPEEAKDPATSYYYDETESKLLEFEIKREVVPSSSFPIGIIFGILFAVLLFVAGLVVGIYRNEQNKRRMIR